jgi:hypothetical protein
MVSETSIKIKSTAAKRKTAKPKAEKAPKRSKLAVRVVARDLKIKNEAEALEAEKISAEPKKTKNIKEEKDFFDRVSRRIEDTATEGITDQDEKVKDKKTKKDELSRPIGLYRKISIFFIILTLALLAAAFYFFFVTLTIEVTPKTERISDKISITVNGSSVSQPGQVAGNQQISGSVEQIPVKEVKIYPATGAEILGQEIVGKVEIINNYSQDKTLVATTRLLSPDGKLYRIKNRVTIPAGGSVSAEIYTDDPSQEMAIGPTEFTIPGLWAGLQDKIFARSSEPFIYNTRIKKFIQAADIEKAKEDLKESLTKKIADQFSGNYKGFDKVIAELDKNSLISSSSARSGDKTEKFTISLKGMVDVVAFKSADAEKLAKDKLISVISADEKLVELEREKMEYNLISSDFKAVTADLEVSFVGSTMLSDSDNILDKERLVDLQDDQVIKYLNGLDKFSSVKLNFMPPFFRRAPSLVDRIKIIIK